MNQFFNQDGNQVLETLSTTREGLTSEEAKERLEKFHKNTLIEHKKPNVISVFLSQFKDLLVIILLVAAVISGISGDLESTVVISVVLLLNAVLGTVQYFKARKSLESLKALSSPSIKVIRDGKQTEIPSEDLVPGDIVILEAGDLVSADGRILENYSLQINESALTGESESVHKISEAIMEEKVPLGDRKNMVFSGSLVTYGRGLVVVTDTGMKTELGKIAGLMNAVKESSTPLQVSLDQFSKKLAVCILAICGIVFGLSVYRDMPILQALMFAVALAVAAIPEALSSIVTIVLAMGTQKMAKEHAIMKDLKSVESLGSVSIICSDKTGTLTQNKMVVESVYIDGQVINRTEMKNEYEVDDYLLKACVLCNDSVVDNGKEIGDPTEIALVNLAESYGLDDLKTRSEIGRLKEIPFDSDRKLMSTLHSMNGKNILFTKGAVDVLLSRLDKIHTRDGIRAIEESDKIELLEANRKLSSQGLRTLAFAYRTMERAHELGLEDEAHYTFIGLVAMMDPPRPESKVAVEECKRAGIKPIMITGDHKITASSIAQQIGIFNEGDMALDGIELDQMSDEVLEQRLEEITVYARVSPAHKIRIVEAWQRKGHIVAMTGDGVNDAPALKKANTGIAMGITGTEVSKDAAAMILTDDNFATIVKAIANGRNIYNNIKNAIHFLLSGNTAGILCVLYTSLLGLPMPFTAVQLLFINLITDSLPAIALGMEAPQANLLDQKPRNSKESLLDKPFFKILLGEGMLIGVFTMLAYYAGLSESGEQLATTMAFATLCLARLFHGFNCRGDRSIFELGLFSNPYTVIAFGIGFVLLNGILFIAPLRELFMIAGLTVNQAVRMYILALAPTALIQTYRMYKLLKNRAVAEVNDKKHVVNQI